MINRALPAILLLAMTVCNSQVSAAEQSRGAVASSHPLATAAGERILANGGNAFDAAVAVASTLTVLEPMTSGIGGYGAILIYDAKEGRIRFLNGSGRFPARTDTDLMRPPTEDYLSNRKGAKAIGTPSLLNAWYELHRRYGSRPWPEVLEDAIGHAGSGIAVNEFNARIIDRYFDELPDEARGIYGRGGQPLKVGDLLVQPDLAKTLDDIATTGVASFYCGRLAERIDRKMKDVGAFVSLEDLCADKSEWLEPIKLHMDGYDVYTAGIPSNGYAGLLIAGVMTQFDLESIGHNTQTYLHVLAELEKSANAVRLTTPGSMGNRGVIEEQVLSEANFRLIANSIDLEKARIVTVPPGKENQSTTHFVVTDRLGNVVSATQTLGNGFGSKVLVDGTGIWMNDSIAFSTYEPKGNPMDGMAGCHKISSNTPVIVLKNSQPWAAFGTPGGHTIYQNSAQLLLNVLKFGMTMQ